KVNRIIGTPYTTLRRGDVIDITRPPGTPPPRPRPRNTAPPVPRVVHEDADLLVVDKPAGTGLDEVLAALGGAQGKPVLRVEAQASGLAVLARHPAALRAATEAFAAGRLTLTWVALVEGKVARATQAIEKALGPDRERPGFVRPYAAGHKRARAARTELEVVETFARHTLVHAVPRTDRGHQLRAHLAALHHPLVGDPDYGGAAALFVSELKRHYKPRVGVQERPLLQRLFLHASRLVLQRDDGALAVEAPLPAELAAALARVRRFSAR
ncbi:MAG TPA: RNA pseudouridine synthase, partial [Planctomycetota bacterium]|nr:RNA pseudouridine synthase [Planctomycetota bacterium]